MFTKQRRTIRIAPINTKYGHLEITADKSAGAMSATKLLPETSANACEALTTEPATAKITIDNLENSLFILFLFSLY